MAKDGETGAETAEPQKDTKLKQGKLPGVTPKRIAEIQEAAESLREVRAQRMELGEEEEKAQANLVAVMKKHGVKAYKIDDEFEAIRESGEERGFVRKIKRKKAKKSADAEDDK